SGALMRFAGTDAHSCRCDLPALPGHPCLPSPQPASPDLILIDAGCYSTPEVMTTKIKKFSNRNTLKQIDMQFSIN
ncbi:MAG: hypothetical protein LC646_00635, partial [Xanthomonadaceae bacterium]|nr:hypothetical protein [Xanthomonadaceae bacterium]